MLEFSLKQLEVFATVARVGSFTRAAQEFYLTQSTVSAHIQALEHALGGPLSQRNARRQVCLTWQGESLHCPSRGRSWTSAAPWKESSSHMRKGRPCIWRPPQCLPNVCFPD